MYTYTIYIDMYIYIDNIIYDLNGYLRFKHLVHAGGMTKPENTKKIKISPLSPSTTNNEQLGDSPLRKALKVIRAHAVLKGRSSCEVQHPRGVKKNFPRWKFQDSACEVYLK